MNENTAKIVNDIAFVATMCGFMYFTYKMSELTRRTSRN